MPPRMMSGTASAGSVRAITPSSSRAVCFCTPAFGHLSLREMTNTTPARTITVKMPQKIPAENMFVTEQPTSVL